MKCIEKRVLVLVLVLEKVLFTFPVFDLYPQTGQAFLSMYDKEDIYRCSFDGTSGSTWDISPPNIQRLHGDLISDDLNVGMNVIVDFTRSVACCVKWSDPFVNFCVSDFLPMLVMYQDKNQVSQVLTGFGVGLLHDWKQRVTAMAIHQLLRLST